MKMSAELLADSFPSKVDALYLDNAEACKRQPGDIISDDRWTLTCIADDHHTTLQMLVPNLL